jgi:hypothetical protein
VRDGTILQAESAAAADSFFGRISLVEFCIAERSAKLSRVLNPNQVLYFLFILKENPCNIFGLHLRLSIKEHYHC